MVDLVKVKKQGHWTLLETPPPLWTKSIKMFFLASLKKFGKVYYLHIGHMSII